MATDFAVDLTLLIMKIYVQENPRLSTTRSLA